MSGGTVVPGRGRSLRGRYRILIVDPAGGPFDEDPAALEHWGYLPVYVDSGAAAMSEAEARRYDLVLVATDLSGPDAWEVTERIRHGHSNTAPPVLGVIDQPHRSTRNRCLAAGMVDTIARPLTPSRVGRLLQKYADHRPVVVTALGVPPAIPGIEESLRESGQFLVLRPSSAEDLPHVLDSGRISVFVFEQGSALGARLEALRESDPEIADVPLVSCAPAPPRHGCPPQGPETAEVLERLVTALRRVPEPEARPGTGSPAGPRPPDLPALMAQEVSGTVPPVGLPTPESDFPRLRAQLRVWASDCARMCSPEAISQIATLAAEFRAVCLPFGLNELAEQARVLADASARGHLDETRDCLARIRRSLEDPRPVT